MTLVEVIQGLEKLKDFEGGNEKQREHLNEITAFLNAMKEGADQIAEAKHVQEIIVTIDGTSKPLPFLLDAADDK